MDTPEERALHFQLLYQHILQQLDDIHELARECVLILEEAKVPLVEESVVPTDTEQFRRR